MTLLKHEDEYNTLASCNNILEKYPFITNDNFNYKKII